LFGFIAVKIEILCGVKGQSKYLLEKVMRLKQLEVAAENNGSH